MGGSDAPRNELKAAPWLLLLPFGLAFLAQLSFKFNLSVFAGVLIYLAAAVVCIWSLGASTSTDGSISHQDHQSNVFKKLPAPVAKRCFEWLLLLAVALIAAFFRLYRLDAQPLSLWVDETLTGLNALEIIEGKYAPLWAMTPLDRWRPDWVKNVQSLSLLRCAGFQSLRN